MSEAGVLHGLIEDVSRQVRLRRAEFYGLRGIFVGALAAAGPLLFRESLGDLGLVAAVGLLAAGGLVGAVYGWLLRVPVSDAARLADRGYGLQDRVATAVEWTERPDRTPLVDALVADAARHAGRVKPRAVVGRRLPREAKLIPVPLVLAVALALAPPIPFPKGALPSFRASTQEDEDKPKDRAGPLQSDERARALKRDAPQRGQVQERSFVPRQGAGGSNQPGDLAAVFKDTALSGQSPDFNAFLKKGDDRLRMLEQIDRLPDLQSDFTQSQHRMMFQRTKELRGGLRGAEFSPEKLRELLNEMERLGRKGGGNNPWGGDISEGMEALEGGQQDRALEAMERALAKMRAMEEQGRQGKGLRGGREDEGRQGRSGRDRGPGRGGHGDEGDFPEGEGSLPGRGKSVNPKGDPTQRLSANPFDVGVEGEARAGRRQGMDTNLLGRGANMPSRLQYLGVLGQYRKMMEEAIAREQVPRDFQDQVKQYFQSLDEK